MHADPPHHDQSDSHIVHYVHVVHHHHRLSVYAESNIIIVEGVDMGERVKQVDTPRGKVQVVDTLDGKGETDEQFKESFFRGRDRTSLQVGA